MSRYIDMSESEVLDDDNNAATVRVVDTREIGGHLTVRLAIQSEDRMGGPNWYGNAEQIDTLIELLQRAKEELT